MPDVTFARGGPAVWGGGVVTLEYVGDSPCKLQHTGLRESNQDSRGCAGQGERLGWWWIETALRQAALIERRRLRRLVGCRG
jgi:hypothetical protein